MLNVLQALEKRTFCCNIFCLHVTTALVDDAAVDVAEVQRWINQTVSLQLTCFVRIFGDCIRRPESCVSSTSNVYRWINQLRPLEPDAEQFHVHDAEVGDGQGEQVDGSADGPHLTLAQRSLRNLDEHNIKES